MRIPLRLRYFLLHLNNLKLILMNTYNTKEAALKLGIKERTVQTKCKKENVRKKNNKYLITDEIIEKWIVQTQERNETQTQITEAFTPEQYDKLQEVIYDYPKVLERIEDYKNEIKYLRKSLEKSQEQMDIIILSISESIQSIKQLNYINAKDKGYDKNQNEK